APLFQCARILKRAAFRPGRASLRRRHWERERTSRCAARRKRQGLRYALLSDQSWWPGHPYRMTPWLAGPLPIQRAEPATRRADIHAAHQRVFSDELRWLWWVARKIRARVLR